MFLTFYEFGKLEASTPSACADRAPAMMGARRLLGAAGVVFVMEKRRNQLPRQVPPSSVLLEAVCLLQLSEYQGAAVVFRTFGAGYSNFARPTAEAGPGGLGAGKGLPQGPGSRNRQSQDAKPFKCGGAGEVQSAKRDAVRLAYRDFTEALEALSVSVLGQGARPLATTRSWVPLLRRWRYYVCSLFSWGLLTEQAVAEAADVLKVLDVVGIIDPLAGSGWHALLWREVGGLSVLAMDSYAVRPVAWAPVAVLEDSRTAMRHLQPPDISRWALFLSWPPHSPDTVGSDLLEKFEGTYFLYLGEEEDPNAGDAGLTGGHQLLSRIEKEGSWMIAVTILAQLTPGLALDLTIEFVTR
eukprot:s294_g2.t2